MLVLNEQSWCDDAVDMLSFVYYSSRCKSLYGSSRLIILRLAVILHICFVSMKSVARVPQHAIYVIGHKQKNRS